jgi:uncharacterized protein
LKYSAQNGEGESPVFLAAGRGHAATVHTILGYRANANLRNYDGQTPLVKACMMGHVEVVNVLLAYGADSGARDYDQDFTPLMVAVAKKSQALVAVLMNYGASVVAANSAGMTALHVAAKVGDAQSVALLCEAGAMVSGSAV